MKKPVSADVRKRVTCFFSDHPSGTPPVPAPEVNVVAQRRGEKETGVVSASGELDLGTVESFRIQVAGAMASDASRVVIDLRHVTFIDSTTLGVLVEAHNRLSAQDRELVIKTQQPLLLRLFEITGLTAVLNIQD